MAVLVDQPGYTSYRPSRWDRLVSLLGLAHLIEPHEQIAGTRPWVGRWQRTFRNTTSPYFGVGGALVVQSAEQFGRVTPSTIVETPIFLYSRN